MNAVLPLKIGPMLTVLSIALTVQAAVPSQASAGPEIRVSFDGFTMKVLGSGFEGPGPTVGMSASVFYGLNNRRVYVVSRNGQVVHSMGGCRGLRIQKRTYKAAICPSPQKYPDGTYWSIKSMEIRGTSRDDKLAVELPRLVRDESDPDDHDGAICIDPDEIRSLLRGLDFFCDVTIDAGAGDDVVWGGYNKETVYGGPGDDTIFTRQGGDTVYGDGPLAQHAEATDARNKIESGAGWDVVYGGFGSDDILLGTGSDDGYGGAGVNTIRADERRLTWPWPVPGIGGFRLNVPPEVDDIACGGRPGINRAHFNLGLPDEDTGGFLVKDNLILGHNCPQSQMLGDDVVNSNQLFLPIPDFHEDPGY